MNKEIEIPEGYEARIEGNKVVLEPKESEDEKTRKEMINYLSQIKALSECGCRCGWEIREEDAPKCERFIAYLEKQKEQEPAGCTVPTPSNPLMPNLHSATIYDYFMFNLRTIIYNHGKRIAAKCLGTHVLDTKLNEYVTEEDVDEYIKNNISCLESLYPLLTPAEWSEEDEKIRNEIIIYIGARQDIDLETHNRWCAYLEKSTNEEVLRALRAEYEKGVTDTIAKYEQKEQKPAEWSEDEKIRKGLIAMLSQDKELHHKEIAYLERQKEQKPANNIKPKFKVGDRVNKNDREDEEYCILTITSVNIDEHCYVCNQCSVIDFEEQDLWHIVEQKPAEWSEEDERIKKMIEDTLHEALISEIISEASLIKMIAYLEKQKEQKPAEIKVVYPNNPKRKEVGFYYNKKEVSWEDMSLADRIHDYPHYFHDGMDYYPFMPGQKPAEWNEDYRDEDLKTRFAFYTYKDEDDVLYLSNVFVEKASRNKGFGTKILAAAEKAAETIGAVKIRLKVKRDSPANAWYRKHGYGFMAFAGDYDWLEKTLEYPKPVKTEWGDEDEKMLASFLHKVEVCDLLTNKENAWIVERLKSLRPQPKQEWSEEDEKMCNDIIDYMLPMPIFFVSTKGESDKEYTKEFIDKATSWLKSLKPQSH